MTATPARSAPRYVVVVRVDCADVYERLRALATSGTDLLWDRRRQERRAAPATVAVERRTRERRREPPSTWAVLGFVIGHRPAAPR